LQVLRAFFLAERLPILTAGDQILCFHLVVACTRLFLWPVSSDQFSPVLSFDGLTPCHVCLELHGGRRTKPCFCRARQMAGWRYRW
jgi:hypothetical protein